MHSAFGSGARQLDGSRFKVAGVSMRGLILNTRLWIYLAGAIFLLIVGLSVASNWLSSRLQWEPSRSAIIFITTVFFLLTIALAFCSAPIMVRAVAYFWEVTLEEIGLEALVRAANRILPAKLVNIGVLWITFIVRHQADIVVGIWVVFLLGLLIASPYIVRNLILSK